MERAFGACAPMAGTVKLQATFSRDRNLPALAGSGSAIFQPAGYAIVPPDEVKVAQLPGLTTMAVSVPLPTVLSVSLSQHIRRGEAQRHPR